MYVISFVVLGMFWIAHHVLFHYVRHVDRRLLWINIVFLLLRHVRAVLDGPPAAITAT